MARLAAEAGAWQSRQTMGQFRAIAWLRWRILVNGFRRKGRGGELAALIITYPILACLALLPTLGAGAGAFYFARHNHLSRTEWLLWGTFAVCQLLNINVGQPTTNFDPRLLIRFPMHWRSFVAIRLFFGLLSPANVLGTLMALAIAMGLTAAIPSLWLFAALALLVFAAANVLFSRMIFAWVDRWLSTRRAREVFTGLIFAGSLALQWVNVTVNPVYNHGRKSGAVAQHLIAAAQYGRRFEPLLAGLPPQLTASSLVAAHAGRVGAFWGFTVGCGFFSAAFLVIFALRMRTEFAGENLSDVANAVGPAPVRKEPAHSAGGPEAGLTTSAPGQRLGFRSTVATVLEKEFLYLRRNAGVFYSLIAPVVMVFLFAGRLATRNFSYWTFPAALGYTLLGVVPLSFNSFGLEGSGAQFYFLAPVRLRDVIVAKNLLNVLLASMEILAVMAIVTYLTHAPSLSTVMAVLLWAAATLLISMAVGNRRSIASPKRIDPARTASRQASPLSALLGIGILLVCSGTGFLVLWGARMFHAPWTALPGMAVFLCAGATLYIAQLRGFDRFALENREILFTELTKS